MNGFTVIEIIVVVALISILSLLGVTNIGKFQEGSLLDSTANEFTSLIRTARSKSMSGEVKEGEIYSDFDPYYLPYYGVSVDTNTYTLFREFKLAGEVDIQRENLETVILDDSLGLSPTTDIFFKRITGESTVFNFIMEKLVNHAGRRIDIDDKGIISIEII